MKSRSVLTGAVLALLLHAPSASAAAASQATAKPLPAAVTARVRNIDVQHVAIDLRFDWARQQAIGSSTLTLKALAAIKEVRFDAAMLTIERATLKPGGQSLRFNDAGNAADGALTITLDREYQPGEQMTIQIGYHTNWVNRSDPNNIWGSFGKGLRFFGPTTTVPTKRRQIWSMSAPQGARYWFPGYDGPDDLRTTELTATVEKPLIVISNGLLVSTTDNPDGTRSFHWRVDTPYPNYLTSVVVGEYAELTQNIDGVDLHTYAYPDEHDAALATIERLPEMVRYFSEVTGLKYPWARYSQVMVQDFPGGVAHATASTITDNMIDDARTHADFYYLWDPQEAQMIAGQWFGHLISPREWQDAWLTQSFQRHLDGLFGEHRNGRSEFLLYTVLTDQATTLGDWNAGIRRPIVTPHLENLEAAVSDNYAFFRGSLVLHMLRKQVGDAPWRQIIQRFVATYAGQQVSTGDFRRVAESVSGQPLGWFFDQWLTRMGHPVFDVSKRYDPATGQLTLNVAQSQRPDPANAYPQARFFRGSVDIEIDDRIHRVWLQPKASNQFQFKLARAPKFVNFDFESTWIKEVRFERSTDELLQVLERSRDITARSAAGTELAGRAAAASFRAADRERVVVALRRVIASDAYWRLRSGLLLQLRGLLTKQSAQAPSAIDAETMKLLRTIATSDTPWMRTSAIKFLGLSRDPQLAPLYIAALQDQSDRVINAAATSLGQSKSPLAFDALVQLISKPSWKSQSLISALNGLKELGDPRGTGIALQALGDTQLPRWWLGTPVWDHRLAAADTLVALGTATDAFPMIFARFKAAMHEDDYNDIFGNMQVLATLGDPRGREAIEMLKKRFSADANAMAAIEPYEQQLASAAKQP